MTISETEISLLFDEFYMIPHNDSPKRVKETENIPKINFSGGFAKRFLFVFETPLMGADLEMITKLIHSAMKLTQADIAMMHQSENTHVTLANVINIMKPTCVVTFESNNWSGIEEPFKLVIHDNCKVLCAPPVNQYHNNIPLKTKLWNSLQPLLA
jgi:hypothetical protein